MISHACFKVETSLGRCLLIVHVLHLALVEAPVFAKRLHVSESVNKGLKLRNTYKQ